MLQLKRNSLSVALACALFAVATGAQAQSDQSAVPASDAASADEKTKAAAKAEAEASEAREMETISVVGIRRGIESAIALKQESTSIVEAISSEDIGKLPDSSIAESIARLPGLAAQRVAGRASTISIRGLAGDFSTTLLNGREQVSSGDNRGVEFDQYPSELLSSVLVYKTPDASLVAQGISGTVDLRTVRPLSYPDRVIAVSARGEQNSLGELNPGYSDLGSRFSASYIDQFADGTVGLAIGFARLDSPGQANRWNAWGYPTGTVNGIDNVRIIGGSESWSSSTDNVRDGVMAVLEFRPSDFYSGAVDVYYSQFERAETTRALQLGLGWSGASLSNAVVDENGVLVAGRFSGVKPILRNDLNTRDDEIFALGFNNEFQFNDDWRGVADFSLSSADRDESILETYAGTVGTTDVLDFTLNPSTGRPDLSFGLNYADPSLIRLTDSGGWGQDGYIKYPKFEDELRSVKLAAERSFSSGFVSSVEFGVNHSHREKSRSVAEAFLDLIAGDSAVVPSDLLNSPANLGFTGIPGVLSYNIPAVFNQFYTLRSNIHPDIFNKDWEVEETVITSFIKMSIDTELGSVPVRGNLGIQHVGADQESRGFAIPGGVASGALPFEGGSDYSDVLPSLNLAFSLPADQTVRFGAAKEMARPRMDQMRANNGFGIDRGRGEWSGGGGNPELEPWRATGYDLSYEKYFDNKGYISAAAFHKDLKSYIYDQTVEFDFSVFDLTSVPGPYPASTIGRFTRPTNGDGGSMNGWEFAVSVPLDMLWTALDGFGIVTNYSDTRSSILPNGPGSTQPLPGLSRYASNITFYYEKQGFSARVSQRSRSRFVGEVQGFGADRDTRYIEGEDILDMQIGYAFGEGSLEGLSLLLQVNNLNNEPYQELFRNDNGSFAPRMYNEYGRTTLLGASYKF
jgi:iron complex outermembrane recepter protein